MRLVCTLELIEDIKMLLRGQQVKKHIMLGADAHDLASFIHLREHIEVVERCIASGVVDQASQHRDGCSLARAIVTEQAEDLVLIQLQVYAIDGLEAILILFV